ncbi:MAG TPA: hypothetical protein VGK73_23440 [Polyangiaceae bacterium]
MPFSVKLEFKGYKEFLRDLDRFKRSAVPYAVRNGLNTAAFEARRVWQGNIRSSFTLRNKFTVNSIRVEQARGSNLATMQSVVGSVAPWMKVQESGGTERGKSKHKVIPAPGAAGLPAGSKRTKAVRPSLYLGRIRAARQSASPKNRNLVTMLMARRKGEEHVILDRKNGGQGLYRISGGRQKFTGKRFRRQKLRVRLLYDLSRSSVRVPPEPTLQRTLKAVERKMPHIMTASFLEQLRRHHILGY